MTLLHLQEIGRREPADRDLKEAVRIFNAGYKIVGVEDASPASAETRNRSSKSSTPWHRGACADHCTRVQRPKLLISHTGKSL